MSNRDGKGAKRRKGQKVSHSKRGDKCPRCRENKLKPMYPNYAPAPHMKDYAFCENPRRRFSNF